jgi:hypothetical protein
MALEIQPSDNIMQSHSEHAGGINMTGHRILLNDNELLCSCSARSCSAPIIIRQSGFGEVEEVVEAGEGRATGVAVLVEADLCPACIS